MFIKWISTFTYWLFSYSVCVKLWNNSELLKIDLQNCKLICIMKLKQDIVLLFIWTAPTVQIHMNIACFACYVQEGIHTVCAPTQVWFPSFILFDKIIIHRTNVLVNMFSNICLCYYNFVFPYISILYLLTCIFQR